MSAPAPPAKSWPAAKALLLNDRCLAGTPPNPAGDSLNLVATVGDKLPLGHQPPRVSGRLAVRREQRIQFVVPGIDSPNARMAVRRGGPRFMSLIPPGVDRPLLSLQGQRLHARGPHPVFGSVVDVGVVVVLEVVSRAIYSATPERGPSYHSDLMWTRSNPSVISCRSSQVSATRGGYRRPASAYVIEIYSWSTDLRA